MAGEDPSFGLTEYEQLHRRAKINLAFKDAITLHHGGRPVHERLRQVLKDWQTNAAMEDTHRTTTSPRGGLRPLTEAAVLVQRSLGLDDAQRVAMKRGDDARKKDWRIAVVVVDRTARADRVRPNGRPAARFVKAASQSLQCRHF